MQPEPGSGTGRPALVGRPERTPRRTLQTERTSARSTAERCNNHAAQSALRAATATYIAEARRILESSDAPSVNVALRRQHSGHDLEAAHQRLVELLGVDGGDYMFVLVEQRSGLTVERPLRLTDYPEKTVNSVWAQPLSRYHFAGQIRRRR